MKNNFVIIIVLFFAITILSRCGCVVCWDDPVDLIRFSKSTDYKISDKDIELSIRLDFFSDITDDGCLVVYVEKEYRSVLLEDSVVFEGFKDSLKIDGFSVRSYHISNGYYAKNVSAPVDYPVYIKEVSIRKGSNSEIIKIVFPKKIPSIQSKIIVSVGIIRINDEIKTNIKRGLRRLVHKEYGTYYAYDKYLNYINLFSKTFPDSSKTALVFSNIDFLYEPSILVGDEAPEISVKGCPGKYKPPGYSNFDSVIFQLNK